MRLKVQYTAQLKREAGTAEEEIEIEEAKDLQQVLKLLTASHNRNFYDILFDENGNFRNSVVLVLNGVQIGIDDPISLTDNDELLLLSPIAGG